MPETFVTHLECSATGERLPAGRLHNLSPAGKPLLVRYDLEAVSLAVDRDALKTRDSGLWRYRELLPLPQSAPVISLGEPATPLIRARRLAQKLGGKGTLIIKDEGRLPTGSFKARGMAVAVSMAKALGVERIIMPSAGNAGAALAAYAARAGLGAEVYVPRDAPAETLGRTAAMGAGVHKVDGLIDTCGKIAAERAAAEGGFDFSTLKEPYRIEGKKTMGLELADQMGWTLPDAIFYPTGGGTGFIGMWKAFGEMAALGWTGAQRPRMIAVQTTGCAPMVRAFDQGLGEAEPWTDVNTCVHGVRVPKPIGDFIILEIMRDSGGFGVAVSDQQVLAAQARAARTEGIGLCLEGAACLAAWEQATADDRLDPGATTVVFNSAR